MNKEVPTPFEDTLKYVNLIRTMKCDGCSNYRQNEICEHENECLKRDIICLIECVFDKEE